MTGTRTLLTGIILGESPRWHDDLLWFCDWGAHQILAAGLDGSSQVMAHVPAFPFCIDWLPDGRLLVVACSDRALLRVRRDGSLAPHAGLAELCDRPWNEIVVGRRGNAYVNCAGYDMLAGEKPASGIIALVTAEGSIRQVADRVFFPNGMAVTPDGRTLIVAESHAGRLTAFSIGADGGLSGRRVWADLGDEAAPDGICLDAEGAVWYADVPNRRCVRVREGNEVLDVIDVDRGCFSCALGGTDGRTLFVTAARWTGAPGAPVRRCARVRRRRGPDRSAARRGGARPRRPAPGVQPAASSPRRPARGACGVALVTMSAREARGTRPRRPPCRRA